MTAPWQRSAQQRSLNKSLRSGAETHGYFGESHVLTVELLLAGIRESSPGRDSQPNCAQHEGKAGGGQEVGRWRGT